MTSAHSARGGVGRAFTIDKTDEFRQFGLAFGFVVLVSLLSSARSPRYQSKDVYKDFIKDSIRIL